MFSAVSRTWKVFPVVLKLLLRTSSVSTAARNWDSSPDSSSVTVWAAPLSDARGTGGEKN